MINWKRKLTSRKFWAAIASFVALLIVATGGTQNQAAQITAIIMAGATVAAYIVGEGLVDSASAGAPIVVNGENIPASTQVTQPDSTCAAQTTQTKHKVTAEISAKKEAVQA